MDRCSCAEAGSNTRILVRKLTKWIEDTNNFAYFDKIQLIIEGFITALENDCVVELKKLSKELKDKLGEISLLSEVEVLPMNVRKIIENVEETLDDVVFSSVPGAGGYDAYYFLVRKNTWNDAYEYIHESFPELQILNVR